MHTWWRWLLETWGFNTAPDYLPWTYSHLWWSWHSLGFNEDANYPPLLFAWWRWLHLGRNKAANYLRALDWWRLTLSGSAMPRFLGAGIISKRCSLSPRICPPTLSTPSRKVSVLIRLWKQHSAEERT